MNSNELSLNEVAEKLGVHYMTVYRYVRTGLLPAAKSGGTWRVLADDLENFASRPSNSVGRGHRQLDRPHREAPPWSVRQKWRAG